MPDIKLIKATSKLSDRNKEKNSLLRVAAYCRVSTDDEEQINSYNSQLQYYNELINKNPEWKMVGIYADKAITGTSTDKRVDFMRMINDAQNGDIDMIITKSISRFARNTVDTLHYVRLLKEKSVAIFFEEEHINTLSMDGELMLTVLSSVAQQEVHNTSEHVKKGLRMKMQRGELIGYNGCLGYDYHPDTKEITLNEEEAKTVRYIFERYLEGAGCTLIAKECTKLGYKTKTGKTTWHESAIRGILRNEKYVGDCLQGKTFTLDPISKRRLRNFGEEDKFYIENHHEGIISKEEFMRVQKILDSRGTPKRLIDGKRQEKLTRQYAFSSITKCGHCGGTYTRRHWHGGKSYDKVVWQCVNNTKGGKKACPNSKGISEDVLEKSFLTAYNLVCDDLKSSFKTVYEEIEKEFDLDAISKDIKKKQEALDKLEVKKQKLIDMKLSDAIDEESYKSSFESLRLEIELAKKDIESLEGSNVILKEKKQNLSKAKKLLEDGGPLTEFDRYVLEAIVERVVVGDENNPYAIKFIFKNKDEIHLNAAEYIMKSQGKPSLENSELLNTSEAITTALQNLGDACGDYCVAMSQIMR